MADLKYIGNNRFDSKVTIKSGGAEVTGSLNVDGVVKEKLKTIVPQIIDSLVMGDGSYNVPISNTLTTDDGEAIIFDTDTNTHDTFPISGSALHVEGDAKITGDLTLGGTITLGDADTDTIKVAAEYSGSMIPDVDDVFDLGSSSKEWKDLYIDGTANVDTLAVSDTFTYGSTTWNELAGTNSITGSDFLFKATTGGSNLFQLVDSSDDIVLKVQDKVVVLGARSSAPTAVAGGIYYANTDEWYLGYE